MSFNRQQYAKVNPTLPTGDAVASYPTYAEAQKAVAYLADQRFPVESLSIVGTDLRSVERVTGRLSYGKVAIAGAMSGAWFGLFVGLLLSMFGGAGTVGLAAGATAASGVWLYSIGIGAGFGLLFSVLSYALTRQRRDFTSSSQIVAGQYAVLCSGNAGEARRLLVNSPIGVGKPVLGAGRPVVHPVVPVGQGQVPQPPVPGAAAGSMPVEVTVVGESAGEPVASAPKIDSRWTTPDGKPKFGALATDHPGVEIPANDSTSVPEPVAATAPKPTKTYDGGDPFATPKR